MVLQTTFGFDSCVMGKTVMVIVRLVLGYNHKQATQPLPQLLHEFVHCSDLPVVFSNMLVLQHTHYHKPLNIVSHLNLNLY
jgi:hypothetical protein